MLLVEVEVAGSSSSSGGGGRGGVSGTFSAAEVLVLHVALPRPLAASPPVCPVLCRPRQPRVRGLCMVSASAWGWDPELEGPELEQDGLEMAQSWSWSWRGP